MREAGPVAAQRHAVRPRAAQRTGRCKRLLDAIEQAPARLEKRLAIESVAFEILC